MNQLSYLIFSTLLDIHGYDNGCALAAESRKYELIYVNDSNRIPYRSFEDYSIVTYRK